MSRIQIFLSAILMIVVVGHAGAQTHRHADGSLAEVVRALEIRDHLLSRFRYRVEEEIWRVNRETREQERCGRKELVVHRQEPSNRIRSLEDYPDGTSVEHWASWDGSVRRVLTRQTGGELFGAIEDSEGVVQQASRYNHLLGFRVEEAGRVFDGKLIPVAVALHEWLPQLAECGYNVTVKEVFAEGRTLALVRLDQTQGTNSWEFEWWCDRAMTKSCGC